MIYLEAKRLRSRMDRQEKLCSKAGASSVIAAYALQYGRVSDSESSGEKTKGFRQYQWNVEKEWDWALKR
jgi:hypothetical protein